MNKITKLLIVLLGASFSIIVSAAEIESASFGTHAEAFIKKLSFPEIEEGSPLTVKCAGSISDRGRFDTILCLGDSNFKGDSSIPRSVGSAIARVAKDSRIVPARVEGRRVDVWYNFSVLYQLQGGTESIEVLDNHLRNKDALGDQYIAAQRYNAKTTRCTSSLQGAVFMQASISATGTVDSVSPIGDASKGGSCTQKLVEAMQGSTYIPAYADGQAVASTYVEIFTR